MSSLGERIDALEARGNALRTLSRSLFLLGACLGIAGFVAIWPEKGAVDVLDATRLVVPEPLAQVMKQTNFRMSEFPPSEIWPGHQSVRIQLGLIPIALVLIWRASGQFVKSWVARSVLAFLGCPIVLFAFTQIADMGQRVTVVAAGQVSAQPRGASPGALASLVLVYHLTPSGLVPVVADQARFVLAQQAYHDEKPPAVAEQLRALTGRWRPDDELTKTTIGVLSDYSMAYGENAGAVAVDIAGGRPYQTLRFHLTQWGMRLAALLVLAGLAADFIGIRRRRSAKAMRTA